jgi:hypothetical protein
MEASHRIVNQCVQRRVNLSSVSGHSKTAAEVAAILQI